MKKLLPLLAIPVLALVPLNNDTAGPYTDSQGRIWDRLPQVSDFANVADFDAAISHEVFTTRHGDQFQFDRQLTPSEVAQALADQLIARASQPYGGSGSAIRSVVTINHPVDEEYRGLYNTIASLKTAVRGEVAVCDAALNANWGIDFVSQSGNAWDSNDTADIAALLDEAFNEHGYGGKDMMIALSNDPTPGSAIGVGYIGLPRQLTKKYLGFEGEIMQHEAGHNYTLQHCCDQNCIMYASLIVSSLGQFHNYQEGCSGQNHSSVMNSQKNRY